MTKFRILFSVLTVLLFLIFTQFANGQSTPRELAKQLLKDDEMVRELTQTDGLSLSEVTKRLTSKKIDLNGDGVIEYIVSATSVVLGCGNANCPHWIYQKSGKKFVPIGDFMGTVVKVRKTKTNGYLDLATYEHSSATREILRLYKFNGSEYVAK